jgi:low affinity Fe/Cu permease
MRDRVKQTIKASPPANRSIPMVYEPVTRKHGLLERLARLATRCAGTSWAFAIALAIVVIWLVTGPIFEFRDTWQLVINTGTTIVTFLMVFLLQRSQNKESLAIQLKLNEIVAAIEGASNRLINVEDLSEEEVQLLHDHYARLAELTKREKELRHSHSIDEAEGRHRLKQASRKAAGGKQEH